MKTFLFIRPRILFLFDPRLRLPALYLVYAKDEGQARELLPPLARGYKKISETVDAGWPRVFYPSQE